MNKVEEGVQKQVKILYTIPDKKPILYERPTGYELTPVEQAVLDLLGKYPGLTAEEVYKTFGLTSYCRILQHHLHTKGLVTMKRITIVKNGRRASSVGYYLKQGKDSSPRE